MSSITTLNKWGIYPEVECDKSKTARKRAIFLIGPPSVGKGEVARFFRAKNWSTYSSSTALRKYATDADNQVVLGQMNQGEIVEPEIVREVSLKHYEDFTENRTRACFDGWGRTPFELREVIHTLFLSCGHFVRFVFLDATDSVVIERSQGRGREDDTHIKKRLEIFKQYSEENLRIIQESFGGDSIYYLDTSWIQPGDTIDWVRKFLTDL